MSFLQIRRGSIIGLPEISRWTITIPPWASRNYALCRYHKSPPKTAPCFCGLPPPTMFEYAPKVFEAWGFRPVTKAFCWVKANKSGFGFFEGVGSYTVHNSEDCWLGIKGRMPRDMHTSQIIFSPIRGHSQKPTEQYEKIEMLYPNMRYLELFARRRRDGWDVFGNEVDGSIDLQDAGN